MRKEEGRRLILGAGMGIAGKFLLENAGVAAAQEADPPKEVEGFENVGLMYHEVSYAKLKGDVDRLLNAGVQPVSLETMVKGIQKEIHIPKDLPIFHLTFDDGLKSQMAALQVLRDVQNERNGLYLPMTFFLPVQFGKQYESMRDVPMDQPVYVEGQRTHNYMTMGDILELRANGCRIENHTANHGDLPSLSRSAWQAEITTGGERIEEILDMSGNPQQYKSFVYPNGHFTREIVEYVKSEGYDIGFGTDASSPDPNLKHLTLRRQRKS